MYQEKSTSLLKNLNHNMSNRVQYYTIIEKLIECDLCENSDGRIKYGFLNRGDIMGNNDDGEFVEYLKGKSVEIPLMIDTDSPCIWFSEEDRISEGCNINVMTIQDYVDWMIYAIVEHDYDELYLKDFVNDVEKYFK